MHGVCMYGDDINRANRDGKLFESWWKNVKYTNKIFFFQILNQNLYFLRRFSRILLIKIIICKLFKNRWKILDKIKIPRYRGAYFCWS